MDDRTYEIEIHSNGAYVTLSAPGPHVVTLTVTNSAGVSDTTTCTVTVAEPTPVTGDLTWAGKASTKEWLWGQNWSGGNPPASVASGIITFDAAGSTTGTAVTNKLTTDYTIGGLVASYTSDVAHKTDLGGHRLTIMGTMMFGDRIPVKLFTITADPGDPHGTLQMGTADSPAILTLGYANDFYEPQPTGTLTVSGGIETHLAECNVSWQSSWYVAGDSVLDLRTATFPDGTFAADTIRVGYRGRGYVKLPPTGGITQVVARHLWLGNWGYGAIGRFGVEATGYKLPAGVGLRIGTPEQPGSIWLGVDSELWAGADCDGQLTASSGGTIEAYLTELRVAYNATRTGTVTAVLDLKAMTSCSITAGAVSVADAPTGLMTASVNLPKGTFITGTLVVGKTDAATASGTLTLNGTVCTPASLTIGAKGKIQINVGNVSSGLDLADGAAVDIAAGGQIAIKFQTKPVESGVFWGLRWAGDHVAELEALHTSARLTWTATGMPKPVSIFARDGFTFVGLVAETATVTSFTVSDATSGSTLVTNDPVVSVAITAEPAEGQTIEGYVVNETGIEPSSGWQASLSSYTILAASGRTVTLHAFAKDTAGNIATASASIYFNTAAPVVLTSSISDNADSDPPATGTATATWTTDIPAESLLQYGPVSMSGTTPNTIAENASGSNPPGTAHSATFATAAGVNYKIVLVNTEVAAAPVYWPKPWPIDGDTTGDCRVNILDLIFIRGRLNQPVTTGDNWRADVNGDTRINILDLIFVRAKLNTQCP